MRKKRLVVKDTEVKKRIKNAEKKIARRNFFELLRRASQTHTS